MNLLERCRQHGWRRLAFIGIAKHAGKTTALNRFLHELAEAGGGEEEGKSREESGHASGHSGEPLRANTGERESHRSQIGVGLLSIGLDGERRDTILGVPKPRVYAEVGTLIASAEGALLDSEARFEWIEELPISSPLGPIMIARVTTPGPVVLAGIRQRAHVRLAAERLEALGCEYILVDGAFDRVAAAAPTLVDAAVLAVGAVVGSTVSEVLQHAWPVIERFALPETDEPWKQLFGSVRDEGAAGIAVLQPTVHHLASRDSEARDSVMTHSSEGVTGEGVSREDGVFEHVSVLRLPRDAVMFDVTRQMGWSDAVIGVYIPGAVTDGVIGGLLRHPSPLQIVADHPAQILISESTHRKMARHGHQLTVWDRLPLAAIAVNPHHIAGADLPRDELLRQVASIAGDVPVYDAMDHLPSQGLRANEAEPSGLSALSEKATGASGEGSIR
ncbi:hypothetical protein [Alicyclobacillus ferrooxydans]|uniref:Uncharacterized protein n=1 Tax=Alicyclobacillus ferrooxydans TaxID=471514 RepID=A0A0P9CT06_9BACL|nr:hypothetical protein [Alicyclobacillus ferrooxydans]KPV42776.1 hypothetical protein AN477_15635 [Alicyclobacillus ferrooxydans]